jgi:hypothetical protein
LGLSYWFTGQKKYRDKALECVSIWFIDPETRMNPHLEYAQTVLTRNPLVAATTVGVDGVTTSLPSADNRKRDGLSILDGRCFLNALDGLALINDREYERSSELDGTVSTANVAFRSWMMRYFEWLLLSPTGIAGSQLHNNHGSWYDVQLCHIALFLGRSDVALQTISQGLMNRLDTQIDENGRQPLEMTRATPTEYEIFNLVALTQLALLGDSVGVNYWGHTNADNNWGSMVNALNSLVGIEVHEWAQSHESTDAGSKPGKSSGKSDIFFLLSECARHREQWTNKITARNVDNTLALITSHAANGGPPVCEDTGLTSGEITATIAAYDDSKDHKLALTWKYVFQNK